MASGIDLRLPQPLDCSNLAKEWPKWKQSFLIYMIANNKNDDKEESKIATFLWLIGQSGIDIFNTLFPNNGTLEGMFGEQTESDQSENGDANDNDNENVPEVYHEVGNHARSLKETFNPFDNHCVPKRNTAMEAFKFNMIYQKEKQSFVEFETALRTQVQYCDFECKSCKTSYADRMLRDRIIVGIQEKKLQLKLLESKEFPLSKIVETCKIFEAASLNKQLLENKNVSTSLEVKVIEKKQDQSINNRCYNCGQVFNAKHRLVCPATNIKCNACGRIGHYKKFCKTMAKEYTKDDKAVDVKRTQQRNVRSINWNDAYWGDSGNCDVLDLDQDNNARSVRMLKIINQSSSLKVNRVSWKKRFQIQGLLVEFKIDTGSDANCIPNKFIKMMKAPISKYVDDNVFDYSRNKINIHGEVDLILFDEVKHIQQSAKFLIVDDESEPILGLETCIALGLVKLVDTIVTPPAFPEDKSEFLKQNKGLFDGLGKFPGKCSIVLKDNAIPALRYKKRLPLSLYDRLQVKLNEMVKLDIIAFVDYPTDWVHNLQLVEKPNKDIRICLDPKPLNSYIKREHFTIPTVDNILSNLSGKRVFTVLDLGNGFWHMELDDVSSDLTTFMTPFGRYRWKRFPFGLNNAPEMFQKKMMQVFGDIPNVDIYFDDIIISGEGYADHDEALSKTLHRAKVNNAQFNSTKIQYRTNKVKIVGHVISEGSVEPDQKHIQAIIDMPTPRNKSDVLRLLGLLKYLAKFIPNFSKRSADLRELTRGKIEFKWLETHEREFRDLLNVITTSPVLAIFDPKLPVIVQTDSSKYGLGSVLLQNDKPVLYASRTLSKSEQKWSQIEKELLAIVFACKRFHYYLYGRDFIVHSDHKPHERLIDADIDDLTPRLQRMYMQLLKYTGLSIVYKPGKEMLVADCLSRAPITDNDEFSNELSIMIHSLTRKACLSKENHELYIQLLNDDEKCRRIISYVENEWPSYHRLDDFSQLFFKFRDELHYENGLLFKNHRLVIPSKLQNKICGWVHAPHLGIEKTLARARITFFWPGMTSDIKELVKSCAVCEKFTRNNQKESLVQDQPPDYPFHKLSADIYEYGGICYLAMIDAYSGFVISYRIKDKSAKSVIEIFDNVFCHFGYPSEIRSDNIPFNSHEFVEYANHANIMFNFSSPRYPQSNGLAEKGVAIVKNILKRCLEAGEVDQFQYRLLEYNTTPVASMGLAPSELFFGRLVKSRLPIDSDLLLRNDVSNLEVTEKLENKRENQKHYYDRHAKDLPALNIGDRVIFKKNDKDWYYGKIVENVNGRSYIIVDKNDNRFRRNRKFIVKTKNNDFDASDMLDQLLEDEEVVESAKGLQTERSVDSEEQPVVTTRECRESSHNESAVPDRESFGSASNTEPVNNPVVHSRNYRTLSGREVRPPKRFGY